jgi:outer membrane scaffolding protein for murein synthesis (MipA/OmpV family)
MLCVAALPAAAQERAAPPRWELGAFALGASQQAYPGSDSQLSRGLVLPFFIYRGEVLRADEGTAGLRALKTERFELDVGFAGAFGARADEVPVRQGMPKLGTLVEFGPRLKWKLGGDRTRGRWQVDLPLRGVFDVGDGFARRGVVIEPELVFDRRTAGGTNLSVKFSAIVGDDHLARTFYGVEPAYATVTRPAYVAQGGLIGWRVGTSFWRHLAPDWRVFGYARIDSVSGAVNRASPLVHRNTGATAGIGVAWTWMRSERPGAD